MAKLINGTRVVTNEVRASYAHVAEAVSVNGGDAKYSMTAIIMAGASVIAYIVGEGLVDAAREEGIEYIEDEDENDL